MRVPLLHYTVGHENVTVNIWLQLCLTDFHNFCFCEWTLHANVIKLSTSPQMRAHTTLWNMEPNYALVMVLKSGSLFESNYVKSWSI